MKDPVGVVFGIQFFSIHDGPGIRTSVFLKGCNLRCAWCHNPESLSGRVEIAVNVERCAQCGQCVKACPASLHRIVSGGSVEHLHDAARCLGCGACEAACPTGAIHQMGQTITVQEVIRQACRDKRFYGNEGGLTITGGEAMMQYDFLSALVKAAHEKAVGVYLETNGSFPWPQYAALLPYLTGILVDWKLTDLAEHRCWTGIDNAAIRENIARFAQCGLDVVLRCPIIPGVNDNDAHLRGIAELTAAHPSIRGAELMPYHKFGTSKARQLGWTQVQEFREPSPDEIAEWKQRITAMGGRLL